MKIVEIGLVGVIGAALLVGAYQHGRVTERKWWRSELAEKVGPVQAIITRSGVEAPDLDQTLIRAIGGIYAQLEDAQFTIKKQAANLPAPTPENTDTGCKLVTAQCLQRPR